MFEAKGQDSKHKDQSNLQVVKTTKDEILEEATDGILLQRRMLESGILSEILLKDHHRALMPLVIAEDAKKRVKERQMEDKPSKNAVHQVENKMDVVVRNLDTQKSPKVLMSPEDAMKIVFQEEPSNDIDRAIKSYFLSQLEHVLGKEISDPRISTSESCELLVGRKMSDFEEE